MSEVIFKNDVKEKKRKNVAFFVKQQRELKKMIYKADLPTHEFHQKKSPTMHPYSYTHELY